MATEEAIAAGLIDWVNSLHVADPVYTVDEFTNGDIIWKVLRTSCLSLQADALHVSDSLQNKSIDSAFRANSQRTPTPINGYTSGPISNTYTMRSRYFSSKNAVSDCLSQAVVRTSKQSPNPPPSMTPYPYSNS